MAKPLQQDSEGNIINDVQTTKNQKGASAYEAELAKKQSEMVSKDQATKNKYMNLMKSGLEIMGSKKYEPEEDFASVNIGRGISEVIKNKPVEKAKGGSIKASSASKRADGCAVKGKTRGRIV